MEEVKVILPYALGDRVPSATIETEIEEAVAGVLFQHEEDLAVVIEWKR